MIRSDWTCRLACGVVALAIVNTSSNAFAQKYQTGVGFAPVVTEHGHGLLVALSVEGDQHLWGVRFSQKKHSESTGLMNPSGLRLRVWDLAALYGKRIGTRTAGLKLLAGPGLVRVVRGELTGDLLPPSWHDDHSTVVGLALSAFLFGQIAPWSEVSLFGYADWNRAESFVGIGVALSLRSPRSP